MHNQCCTITRPHWDSNPSRRLRKPSGYPSYLMRAVYRWFLTTSLIRFHRNIWRETIVSKKSYGMSVYILTIFLSHWWELVAESQSNYIKYQRYFKVWKMRLFYLRIVLNSPWRYDKTFPFFPPFTPVH